MKKKIVEWKFQKELTFQQILKTLLIIYLHPFLFHSLYFYPTLRPNKVLIWSWRLCGSDIDMTKKKKVWYKYFWHPFMRLLVLSWLSVFSCDLYVSCLILLTLFRSHILLRVLLPIWKWFHLLSDNTGKIWVKAYFQIEIRVKFILKLRVWFGWLPLFTHIEFWWHAKFL